MHVQIQSQKGKHAATTSRGGRFTNAPECRHAYEKQNQRQMEKKRKTEKLAVDNEAIQRLLKKTRIHLRGLVECAGLCSVRLCYSCSWIDMTFDHGCSIYCNPGVMQHGRIVSLFTNKHIFIQKYSSAVKKKPNSPNKWHTEGALGVRFEMLVLVLVLVMGVIGFGVVSANSCLRSRSTQGQHISCAVERRRASVSMTSCVFRWRSLSNHRTYRARCNGLPGHEEGGFCFARSLNLTSR